MFRRRALSTSCSLRAAHTTATRDLHFPTNPHPTPFEIFHLSPDDELTSSSVKARYYELCKLYHPDLQQAASSSSSTQGKGKGKATTIDHPRASDPSSEFKQIVAAYELLRNPARRTAYLTYGDGWVRPPSTGSRGFRNPNGDAMGYPVHFRRGRPMASSARRPTYSSSAYDWHTSGASASGWTDPYDSFWSTHPTMGRTPNGSERSGPGTADPSTSGWKHQGQVGRNGTIFLALATLTLFATPLAVWSSSPTLTTSTESGWMPVARDRRHRDASLALETARREARKDSEAKREAIRSVLLYDVVTVRWLSSSLFRGVGIGRRRVQQIEHARAIERADQVERIARGPISTGHDQLSTPRRAPTGGVLALPPPSNSPSNTSHSTSGLS
ncbi:BZ3500_MvSof-1268-A1-R1_Chr2-2g04807 [Microbotryum saponariae]|uniref:BZ3500_MvSof-1268-A1-R1_Chr2-2g04807 protein n=1 Tax=Microbotryum saponariae TaxID=289078 RepID=A0A2X0L6U2_9BASI|nr:BZ3500_MvSof-1268-A1-R1_Chr2-2g04807 [Microbotryum saponariae]SDA00208.1 BZ3501_MvSof-1269-A2-R1_Chr2-2g04481 [Microbotryum saponariae]